jgi:4-amino-4-deoxy-L-arabinose transferase-like glycosyltransferase
MRPVAINRVFVLFLLALALFVFGNGLITLTDPDEAFYCLTAHEMSVKNEWLTPLIFGQPQFEKPPLVYWLLEAAFKTWGESPFTARLFPAAFAALGVMAVYFLGLMGFKDERKAFLSAMVLASCGFYAGMGKLVFTDMIFTVLILCAMAMFVLGFVDQSRKGLGTIGFYVFAALATLAKTPLAFLVLQAAVILFLLYRRQMNFLMNWWTVTGISLYVIIALPWYAYIYHQYGQAFIDEFFKRDHWRRLLTAEHRGNDHLYFYPLTMMAGIFPWSLFLVASWVDLFKRLKSTVSLMDYLCLSWLIAVLAVFEFAHSKLTSYILPLFPAMALMTGNYLGDLLFRIQQRKTLENLLFASFGLTAVLGIAAVVAAGLKKFHPYVPSMGPVFFLSGSLITLSGIGISVVLKERYQTAMYVLALSLLPVFMTAFMVSNQLQGYVSSREASEYVPPRAWGAMTVLTSKTNARGIRYYTGQNVAVLDFTGKPFFSPHPIPILDTNEKVLNALEKQPWTIGVVRKSAYQDIVKNFGGKYHVALLKVIGMDYVIRVEPLKHL